MSTSIHLDPPTYLMPTKFLLLLIQILLLTLILQLREEHIYWQIGFDFNEGSTQYKVADKTLVGVTVCYIIIMAFEFLTMILGISLLFHKLNLAQIVLHSLGCVLCTWFILDSWRYTYMWVLWGFFGIIPFVLEVFIIVSAFKFGKDLTNNNRGMFK